MLVPAIRDRIPFLDNTLTVKMLIGLIEAAFVIYVLQDRTVSLPGIKDFPRPTVWLLSAWLSWSVLAVMQADHVALGFVRQAEWWMHILFGVAASAYLVRYPWAAARIPAIMAAGILLYAFLFVLLWALLPSPEALNWTVEMPGFSNIRHFGFYLVAAVAFVSAPLLLREKGYKPALWAFIVLTIVWAFLLWTGGRGALISLAASIFLLAVFGLVPGIVRLLFVNGLAGITGAFVASAFPRLNDGLARLAQSASGLEGLESPGRLTIWSEAVARIQEQPWFGLGPDGFLFARENGPIFLVQPHNFPLQAALEWGLPGAILALLLIGGLLLRLGLRLRAAKASLPGTSIAGLWAAVALLIHSLVDGTLYHAMPMFLIALGLALASTPLLEQPSCLGRKNRRRRGLMLATALAATPLAAHATSFAAVNALPPFQTESLRVAWISAIPTGLSDRRAARAINAWIMDQVQQDTPSACLIAHIAHARFRRPWSSFYGSVESTLSMGDTDRVIQLLKDADSFGPATGTEVAPRHCP